jgi:hypothetical protein
MKNAIAGIALALAAIFGGNYVGNALCGAVDAPRARFDAAADAHIAQLRREAEQERQLAGIRAALTTGH